MTQNTDTLPSLLPCPFCGSDEVSMSYSTMMEDAHPLNRFIECEKCGAMGPSACNMVTGDEGAQQRAVEAWNDRRAATRTNDPSNGEAVERIRAFNNVAQFLSAFEKFSDDKEVCYGLTMGDLRALSTPAPNPDPIVGELVEALKEVREYFDQRADAECDPSGPGYSGNEEMRLLVQIDAALAPTLASDNLRLQEEVERLRGALVKIEDWCCPVLCNNCADNRKTARAALNGHRHG